MKTTRLILLLALLIWAIPAGAQTTAVSGDTVHITIQGDLNDVTIVPFPDVQANRIGDTLFFQATALDSEGDPVTGIHWTWASSDSTVISIDSSTGVAVAHRKGTVDIYVMGELFDRIAMGFLKNGVLEMGRTSIAVGEYVEACAFMMRGETVVAGSSLACLNQMGGASELGPERLARYVNAREDQ